jgi:hypothetical protein
VELDDPFGDSVSGSEQDVPVLNVMLAESELSLGEVDGTGDVPVALPGETTVDDDGSVDVPRGGPVAGGRRVTVPAARPLPRWAPTDEQDRGDEEAGSLDYHDLADVNRDLLRLRARLHRVRRGMRQAARDAVEAKLTYHRALRRALVQQSGGSAESRKASAELLCEDLEADMVMKLQVVDEFNSLFRAIRDDVENAKTVAYNLRALMQIL